MEDEYEETDATKMLAWEASGMFLSSLASSKRELTSFLVPPGTLPRQTAEILAAVGEGREMTMEEEGEMEARVMMEEIEMLQAEAEENKRIKAELRRDIARLRRRHRWTRARIWVA